MTISKDQVTRIKLSDKIIKLNYLAMKAAEGIDNYKAKLNYYLKYEFEGYGQYEWNAMTETAKALFR